MNAALISSILTPRNIFVKACETNKVELINLFLDRDLAEPDRYGNTGTHRVKWHVYFTIEMMSHRNSISQKLSNHQV